MDLFYIAWVTVGGVLGALIGRQVVVITLKQRQLSIDSGLDWPWEWANSFIFQIWAVGLGFILALVILVFTSPIVIVGFLVGIPVGYFLRNVLRISTSMPDEEQEEGYTGD